VIPKVDSFTVSTQSGSSIATALAAGLAALIVYCVALSEREHYKEVLEYEEMTKTFKSMTRTDGNSFLRVWDVFKPLGKDDTDEQQTSQVRKVVNILKYWDPIWCEVLWLAIGQAYVARSSNHSPTLYNNHAM
jgi:hypothetical protein